MPTVPTVHGPSVEQAGLPSAYETAPQALGRAGAVVSEQLGGASHLTAEYAKQVQNRDDLDAVFRAETGLKDEYLKFERDELGKKGVDAKGASERAAQWWDDAQSRYGEGLNARQQFAFRRTATAVRQASSGTLGRHEQQQSDISLQESAQARISTAAGLATMDPTEERVATARKEIMEAVQIGGKAAGYTPEIMQAKTNEALTLMHKGVVLRLVDQDADAANAYFYQHRKEIDTQTQVTLEHALKRGGVLQKAQTAADEILNKFTDLGEASKYIEKNFSGEQEEAVKKEVEHRFTVAQAAKTKITEDAYGTASLAAEQRKSVPAAVWARMDDAHRAAIIAKQDAIAKADKAAARGEAIKTDFPTWDRLNRQISADPQGFAKQDLAVFMGNISGNDLQQLADVQRRIRQGGDEAKNVTTTAQQIDTALDGIKVQNNTERSGQARRAIYDALDVAQKEKGRALSYEEKQKVIDQQIMQVTVPGVLWDSTKRSFEVQGTPDAAKAKVVVPDNDRALITQALQKRGRPVTDAAILDLYKRSKGLQ